MFRAGFDVHHIDGDHDNNDPANLVLLEHTDHMMLHGMGSGETRKLGRLSAKRGKRGPQRRRTTALPDGRMIWLAPRERAAVMVKRFVECPQGYASRLVKDPT